VLVTGEVVNLLTEKAFYLFSIVLVPSVKMLIIRIVISTNSLRVGMNVTLRCVISSWFSCLVGCCGSF